MNFIKTSLFKYIIVFFIPALFFTGCGVWENFTTYFNLYYNTSDAFEEAEKAIYEQKRELFSTEDLQVPGTANQLLTKVIEKASKILQFNASSGLVDDALLMLGKSFYYQKSYQKALRKFQELIATRPNSDLVLETQLWIGKSQMRLKDYQNALITLKAVRDTAGMEGEEEIVKDAFVEVVVYHIVSEDYQEAIKTSKEFIENISSDEIKAEVYYELGKLYFETDDIENAIASYREVNNFSPSYEVELRANVELAKSLRKAGKSEEALSILEDMSEKDKYSDAFPEIDLETGITLKALGKYSDAIELLTYVDTSYANTPFSGTAKFNIAEIYEYNFKNFDSASVYYTKNMAGNAPPEIIIASNAKAQKFKKYQYLVSEMETNAKQLSYLLDSSLYVRDSTEYAEELRLQEQLEIEQNAQLNNDMNLSGNNGLNQEFDPNVNQGTDPLTQGNIPLTQGNTNPNNPITNTNTGIDNTNNRRPPQRGTTNQLVNTPKMDKKAPAWPTFSRDSLKSLIVKNKFELANLFFTEFDLPDSAYFYYSGIVDSFPNSLYNARSLYGIGSYYQTINDTSKADSIFNIIYTKYKTEDIVNAAAVKLNKPIIDLKYDPAKDLYAEAEKLMIDKNYTESANKFYNIYLSYPKSDFAPKALYAGGWILENDLKLYDSAAVMYDSLSSGYPKSVYASTILSKLQVYKTEKENIRKAVEDSLRALKQISDSLIVDSLKADSLGSGLPADSLGINKGRNQPVLTPLDNKSSLQKNKPKQDSLKVNDNQITTPVDSLKQEHETIIDSLTRSPDTPVDTIAKPVEINLDSIPPSKNKID